jgi:hypothetical protein
MGTPQKPVPGDLHIDASDVNVTDITPDQILKLTKVREGFDQAVSCVLNVKPEDIARAGVNKEEVARLGEAFATDKRIGELLPAAEKLVELLYETRQLRRHDMGMILAELGAQVRRRADRSPNAAEVLGPFGAMLEYQYAPGAKAAATKEKAKDEVAPEQGAPA